MEKPEMVIFDVDGLMLNTEWLWKKAWEKVSEDNHCPQFAEVFKKVVGISGNDVVDLLDREMPDVMKRREMLAEARTIGTEYLESKIETMPGVLELLDVLEEKGIRKAVATTTSRDATYKRLKRLGIFERFEFIICGDEVKNRKPDPEIYLRAVEETGCNIQRTLVLEDTGYGVQAAHGAGLAVVMVPSINPPTAEQEKMTYKIMENLNDVKEMILNM